MSERLIISAEDKAVLDRADEILDQLGEDAQDLGQDDGARVARQAAEAVRKFTGRLDFQQDPITFGPSGYRLRGR